MPLDLASSPLRPQPAQMPVPAPARVAVIGEDALSRASLRRTLLHSELDADRRLELVDDPEHASILVWAPPMDLGGDLPELPGDASGLSGPSSLIVLLEEGRDPFPFLAIGARGILRRGVDGSRLRATVLAASLGLTILDEDPADALVASWSPDDSVQGDPGFLTPRERDVLTLLADGLSNRGIAEQLGISAHTVKFHVDSLLAKLDARSRTQAVVLALRRGLLALD